MDQQSGNGLCGRVRSLHVFCDVYVWMYISDLLFSLLLSTVLFWVFLTLFFSQLLVEFWRKWRRHTDSHWCSLSGESGSCSFLHSLAAIAAQYYILCTDCSTEYRFVRKINSCPPTSLPSSLPSFLSPCFPPSLPNSYVLALTFVFSPHSRSGPE